MAGLSLVLTESLLWHAVLCFVNARLRRQSAETRRSPRRSHEMKSRALRDLIDRERIQPGAGEDNRRKRLNQKATLMSASSDARETYPMSRRSIKECGWCRFFDCGRDYRLTRLTSAIRVGGLLWPFNLLELINSRPPRLDALATSAGFSNWEENSVPSDWRRKSAFYRRRMAARCRSGLHPKMTIARRRRSG